MIWRGGWAEYTQMLKLTYVCVRVHTHINTKPNQNMKNNEAINSQIFAVEEIFLERCFESTDCFKASYCKEEVLMV